MPAICSMPNDTWTPAQAAADRERHRRLRAPAPKIVQPVAVSAQFDEERNRLTEKIDMLLGQRIELVRECNDLKIKNESLRERLRDTERLMGKSLVPTSKIRDIQRAVSCVCMVGMNDLISSRRKAFVIRARHVAMLLSKMLTGASYPEIGRKFGDMDHTSVKYAVDKLEPVRVALEPKVGTMSLRELAREAVREWDDREEEINKAKDRARRDRRGQADTWLPLGEVVQQIVEKIEPAA